MGFIPIYFTGFKHFCKPATTLLAVAVLWALVVWGLWPLEHLRLWRELGIFAVLGLWCWAWWQWSVVNPQPLKAIALPAVVLMALCVAMQPFQSTDLYGYINRGWQQVAYQTNPYATPIAALPGWQQDPVLTNHWVLNPCPYGVLFAHIARVTCMLGSNKVLLVYGFKVAQLMVWLFTFWVLDCIRLRAFNPPDRLPLVAFCWHPLVLVHGLANGHNDGWVGLGNVLAAWATVPLPVLTPLFLTLGGLIKVTPFVALPLTWLTLWRLHGWRVVLVGSGWAVAVALWLAWPYLQQPLPWHLLADNAGLSHNSLHALLTDLYQPVSHIGGGWLPGYSFMYGWLKGVFWGAYALIWVYLTSMPLWKKPWRWSHWLLGMLALQAGLLLLASSKFHGWYLNMVLPLLWLLPLRLWWVRALLAVSLAYCFGVSFLGRAHIANTLLMTVLPVALVWWHHRRRQVKVA
jgi:alpha-1,6-mannosyltransferase